MKKWAPLLMMCAACACTATGGGESQPAAPLGDKYATPMGEVFVYPVGHGSVMLSWNGKTIQVDPYSKVADYSQLPQADLLLITHDHYDHLDPAAWKKTVKPTTHIITTAKVAPQMDGVTPQVMQNGEKTAWEGIQIDAVPAYNIVHKGPDGNFFHPKGEGNGYILHLYSRRYGKHTGNAKLGRAVCGLSAQEPALYDDGRNVCGCGLAPKTQTSVSLPLL